MTAPAPRGLFVTFEGIEGSGKSTQLERLARRLAGTGRRVVVTREPGGTALGARIRALVLAPASTPPCAGAELLLYLADRAQHLAERIEPALAGGAIVLCDRFSDATLAYQGGGRALGVERLAALHRTLGLDRRPDRTLLFDLPAEHGLARARARNSAQDLGAEARFEALSLEFHETVRRTYLELARADPQRIRIVPADAPPETVEARVAAAVADLVPLGGS
jgi:dTMP kinase